MKASFLLLIFNPPFNSRDFDEIAKLSVELNYLMFAHNGIVYNTVSKERIFHLSDLI